MTEKQVAIKILLDNYFKGNKWLSNLDIQNGYRIEENGIIKEYYTNLSRRISDANIRLSDGKEFYALKDNHHMGTKYTAYKLPSDLSSRDIEILHSYANNPLKGDGFKRKRISKYKKQKPKKKMSIFEILAKRYF